MASCKTLGYVHSLESFGSVDGPGVRFVVFLQGCALRCKYCHNPETWAEGGEAWTAEALFQRVYRYRNYWGKKGGITVSGGEPLRQMEFLTAFFELARSKGVHTALDTAGQPFSRHEPFFGKFKRLMEVTDLLLLDIKHMNDDIHIPLTHVSNKYCLDFARYLAKKGKKIWIRYVVVPSWSDDVAGAEALGQFIHDELNGCVEKVELLPYHELGKHKWEAMGEKYMLDGIHPPKKETMERVKGILEQYGHKVMY
mgnify:CR=1 FL=1